MAQGQPLAWEHPCAVGMAKKKEKKKEADLDRVVLYYRRYSNLIYSLQ